MKNDPMLDRNRLIELLLQVLTELGWKPSSGDVIDEIVRGGVLTVPQAAIICGTADQTIYRWIEDADNKGRPLGKTRRHGCLAPRGCSTISRNIKEGCRRV
jgi:hypothetical protein